MIIILGWSICLAAILDQKDSDLSPLTLSINSLFESLSFVLCLTTLFLSKPHNLIHNDLSICFSLGRGNNRGEGNLKIKIFCLTRVTDKKMIGAKNKTDVKKRQNHVC